MFRDQWQTYLDQADDQPHTIDGVSYLPELGIMQFGGSDTLDFLQGYLTCDTLALREDTLTAVAICNLKGRVVANGWSSIAKEAAGTRSVLLVVHRSLVERLVRFFKPYSMFSKTEIRDLSDATLVFGVPVHLSLHGYTLDPINQLMLVDDLLQARTLWDKHPHRSAHSWQAGLIEAGIPLVSEATSEAFLPQMLDLDRLGAGDCDKGCYLGQEVVARAQHRGAVKRRLQRLNWRGNKRPQPGASVTAVDDLTRKVGTVINSVTTNGGAGTCLAIVAIEAPGPFRHDDTILDRPG